MWCNKMKLLIRPDKIFSYAMYKKDMATELESSAWNIAEHIVKLSLYPINGACRHWRKEIFAFLNKMNVLKGSNKLPSKDFLFKCLYESQKPYLDGYINYYIVEYGEPDVNVDVDRIKSRIKEYFEWVSDKLSSTRRLHTSEVYTKLDDLGLLDNGKERFGNS